MSRLNTLIELDRTLIKKGGLKKFIELSWYQIEPAKTFVPGWHIDAICEHLEAISRAELTRLVINIPPGCMKSLTACVFWPAWVWTFQPETKWIYASYSMALSRRDNLRMRRLIESEWYRARFGEAFRPLDDNWGTAKFVNDRAGFRLCTSVDGTVTGEHADVQVCDDPIKGSVAIRKNGYKYPVNGLMVMQLMHRIVDTRVDWNFGPFVPSESYE